MVKQENMSINKKRDNKVLVLRKSRSYRADFAEALSLFVTNGPALLRSLLLPALMVGLVLAVLFALWRVSGPAAIVAESVVALLLVLYGLSVLMCILRHLVSENLDLSARRLTPVKTLKAPLPVLGEALTTFYALVVFAVVLGLLAFGAVKTMSVSPFLIIPFVVVAFLLAVPWNLTLSALLYSDDGAWRCVKDGFRWSRRSFGSTLMLVFLSTVILALVACIAFLPLFVLNLAISASNAAVACGDPTDLPSYVYVVHFVLSVLLMGIVAFASLVWLLPQWLHYYSVLTREDDRLKETKAEDDFNLFAPEQ